MKILLLRPPLMLNDEEAISKIEILQPPIGIASIAAFLKSKGYKVNVIDMYNFSWEQVYLALKQSDADIFGITCITGQHFNAFKLAKEIKHIKLDSPSFVVIGGPHVNMLDTQILYNVKEIDFVVREEGELAFFELLQALEERASLSKVRGLTYRDGTQQIIRLESRSPIEDLDSLPFPDYSFFDFDKNISWNDGHIDLEERQTRADKLQYAPIITSRGCPNKCLFCAIYLTNTVRFRSVRNVVDEIESLHRQKGLDHFSFVDDCFCMSLKRTEDICDEIIHRGLKITFTAVASVNPLSERVLIKMKKAGCIGLNFGVESGSPKILKVIRKGITPEEIVNAFQLIKKVGIRSTALLMVGNPGEDKKTIVDTIRLLKKCKPDDIIVSPLIILPNSDIYKIALKQRLISSDYWFKNSCVPFYTAEYSADELRYLRLKLLLNFHMGRKKYKKVLRIAFLSLGSFIIIRLGLHINRVRDLLLSIGPLRKVLKYFTT